MSVRLLAVFLVAATTGGAASAKAAPEETATGVLAQEVRVDGQRDGSALVTVTLRLAAGAAATQRAPLPWAELGDARLTEAPAGSTFAITGSRERPILSVTLPEPTTAPVALRLVGRVADAVTDAGSAGRSMRVALMNLDAAPLRDLSLVLVFPDGSRAHAIREALPKPGRSEAGPRALLEAIDGRAGARLQVKALAQGETAALKVELGAASRSPAWLIVGLALAALYLRSFRDLVHPPKT